MKKKTNITDDDIALFRDALGNAKPLKQDKIQLKPKASKEKQNRWLQDEQKLRRQASAAFEFSDGFEAHFNPGQTVKYVKPGSDSHEVKRLRRGDYPPELILDLHGYNRQNAKPEIAALIAAAQKQHCLCVCIVHGIGSKVLKQAIPSWLVQHPAVTGFHQAPLEWGGDGALLVLIDLPREHRPF